MSPANAYDAMHCAKNDSVNIYPSDTSLWYGIIGNDKGDESEAMEQTIMNRKGDAQMQATIFTIHHNGRHPYLPLLLGTFYLSLGNCKDVKCIGTDRMGIIVLRCLYGT